MATYLNMYFDPATGDWVHGYGDTSHPDVIGVMDGYESDIEAIYIKGNPIPEWNPLPTTNKLSAFGGVGVGGLTLPEWVSQNWWLVAAAGVVLVAVAVSK